MKLLAACGFGCLAMNRLLYASAVSGEGGAVASPLADRGRLLIEFRGTNSGALQYMRKAYGEEIARAVTTEAEKRFEPLLPVVPDLGGAENVPIGDFPVAMWCVAYLEPMKAHGRTAEDLGKMIYDLFDSELRRVPETLRRTEGAKLFSPEYIERLKVWSGWTRKKEYPGNWVADFVPGEGANFDYGYDYTQCAIVEYLKAHGALEAAPYVCVNDFLKSRTYGTGLVRSKTLAMGFDVCNFRYKKDRPVRQDWATEITVIRAREAASVSGL